MDVRLADRDLDVRIEVAAGEVLAVLGPNGAGKSTMLEIVAGLLRPDSGQVWVGGHLVTDTVKGIAVPPHRRGVSLLAQDALLFPHLTVAQNVAFGPRSSGLPVRGAREVAEDWLAAVDAVELSSRKPAELSGGQAQRVALARALAVDPRLLLLDEPMAALDVAVAPAMRALLRRVLREPIAGAEDRRGGRCAVLVTHDIIDALTLADRLVVVESGRVVESGPVAAVLARPRSAFAARIAGVNLIVGQAGAAAGGPDTDWVEGVVHAGDVAVHGRADRSWQPGKPAAAVFSPTAVSVHRQPPEGSPRNTFAVRIAELTDRGGMVRVQAADSSDGSAGLVADITPAAVAELDLSPGMWVHLAVKAVEVQVYPC
ncbi:sulfate/molybdate ABC transporter ATP-binding protein [Nocardia australiensis]|uniref:sulfate/molybdate ABC transporter ATP-binding protein n=1 Tax=Nocardia australiensis TaxID=2887191 RepID=UPI001D13DEF7|nr:ATP-binding cassette domain-containing protein [Nocardia australiensis]